MTGFNRGRRNVVEQHAEGVPRRLTEKTRRILGRRAYGREMGKVLVTRPDTGSVQQQAAYYDSDRQTWTVQVSTYPTIEQSTPGRSDPIGRAPMESETYAELSQEDMERRYPELWEKVKQEDETL